MSTASTALAEVGTSRPRLQLVPERDATPVALAAATPAAPTGSTRARVVLALVAVIVLSVLVALNGAARRADALDARPAVAGHAVISPGESLWDVAVEFAPAGSDPRRYLAQLQELNDLEDPSVPAWTVVLLPETGGS